MNQELKEGMTAGPEPETQAGQPQGAGAGQSPNGQAAVVGGFDGQRSAGGCSCESQVAQGGPAPAPGPAVMMGHPGGVGCAGADPVAHTGGCSCESETGGLAEGYGGPAGSGPQPHCEHHYAHPGPIPGMMPGPMPGQFAGPFPGVAPGPMPGMAYGAHPGHGMGNSPMGQTLHQNDAQFGQMMGMFNDIISGNANMSSMAGFLGSMDNSFWKGALVGAGLALLVSGSSVKNAFSGLFSGLGGQGATNGQNAPAEG